MGNTVLLADLLASVPLVGPSLLACDFGNLEREVRRLEEAGARVLHLDVMDGHFVPTLSLGVPVVEAVRRITDITLDVHLMISNPEQFIEPHVHRFLLYLFLFFGHKVQRNKVMVKI